jgi:hypothetical protein
MQWEQCEKVGKLALKDEKVEDERKKGFPSRKVPIKI